ncbi:MAG: DUF11 domain-containing protein [Myroides sp.]|jgi:uncharacterized repeat protein (TIGR01451 family)|nr:DUF11 domain-containing protein [Myroides sp.]
MKQKTTFSLWKRLLLLLVLFVPLVQSFGQARVDAKLGLYDKTDHGGLLGGSKPVVINPENVNQFDNNYARLEASPGLAVGLGSYTSYIELVFTKTLEANQTSYVRLQPDGKLLEGLLGGSLGELLSGVLGAVLTGNQEFDITVGLGQQSVLFGSSTFAFKTDTGTINVVKDKDNYYYLAITPTKKYDRIKLRNKTGGAVGLGVIKNLDVFHAFAYDEKGADCGKPSFTSFDGSGLNLDVLAAQDPMLNYAIDNDKSTYSTLNKGSLLSVKVGGSMSQKFYFPTISDEKSSVNIRLAVRSSGVLDLNLLGGVEVLAYYGKSTAPVYQKSLSGGLITDLNLLNLIKDGKAVDIMVAPGKAFDRLEVRMKAPVGLDVLGSSVRIYDVERFDGITCKNPSINIPPATEQPFDVASCATKLEDFKNVDFPFNAIDGNNETYTTLTAFNGNLLVSGPQSGSIHMKYDTALPANKTSYIRIDADKDMLNALLGGTLGKLVADLGGLILGNHIFTIEAYNTAGTQILKSSSSNQFEGTANGAVKLVQDNIGRYYLAVTPSQSYQSIVVSNSVSSLLPTGENRTLKVYNMCTDIGTDLCYPAQFTSYDQKGISLSVSDLGKAGVKNPYHAISGNSSNYSEISNGLLSVGGLVKQTVYFNQPSQLGDELKVRLQLDPSSLLSLDLLGGYKIVTSLGGEEQESFTLQQGLINSLNLLDLFKSGGVQTLSFDTKKVFDRVDIRVVTVLNVSVTPSIRLYDIKRISKTCPEKTTVSPFIKPVCATTIISASNVDDIDNIFSDNFDAYATLNSGAGFLLGLGDKHSGHIELGYDKEVSANTTSYVRIDFDEKLLNALLGGSLGNVVNGLVNELILGNHFFEVEVKNAGNKVILDGKSNVNSNTAKGAGTIRVVTDKLGRTYLAITPTEAYKSIRITDKTNSALGVLAKPNTMNVYSMCYESDTNSCVPSFATSYEYSGLALDVKDLSGAGVKYPERAIDDNTTNYSEISSGTLKIGGSVKQFIYFNSDAKAGEEVSIKFRTQGGQVNVGLIGAIEIKAYKGDKEVDAISGDDKGLINGINVLDLLTKDQIVELPFKPKAAYDRISVGLKELVGVSVGASLHLYDVARICKTVNPNQTLVAWKSYKVNNDATIKTVKGGEEVEYTIHVRNEGTTPIADFIVKDKMPKGVKYKSSVAGVVNDDEVVFKHSATLAPGASTSFVFTVDVDKDLTGLVEIKNIAYVGEAGQELGKEIFYPSFPPIDNTNPTQPDGTKSPGTVIKVVGDNTIDKPTIVSVDENGVESTNNKICVGTFITLKVKEEANTYQWYFNGSAIDNSGASTNVDYGKEQTLVTDIAGEYTAVIIKDGVISKVSDVFEVITKPLPVITIEGEAEFMVKIGETVTYPKVSSTDGNIVWFDPQGQLITTLPTSFDAPGVYPFTAIVEKDGCAASETIIVTVFDNTGCPPTTQRVYAQGTGDWKTTWYTTLLGGVSNKENATDANPTTHSTITLGLSVLGLGTTWQNIYFDGNEIPAGTPVSVKLGNEYSLLAVGDGITVVGLDKKGKDIGVIKSVGGGLLKLLSADNVYEYTFVPSNSKGPQPYYGVKIIYSAAVGAGASMKIYGAYYNAPGDSCTPNNYTPADNVKIPTGVHPQILDIHHGIQDIGLGVATSLSPFVNPWRAVDNDPDSYAYINRSVAVINAATLTVLFKQQSMPGDELHIDIEDSANPVLSLDLLKGFKIQRYLGDKKVGPELEAGGDVLGLKLLGIGKGARRRIIVTPFDTPFDRVKIFYGNILSVLGSETRIFDVSLNPQILKESIDLDKYYDVCVGGTFTIENNDGCTEFKVFTNKDKTEEIATKNGKDFILSSKLQKGQHSIYVQGYRNGCEVGHLQEVRVNIQHCAVKSNLNITHKIK